MISRKGKLMAEKKSAEQPKPKPHSDRPLREDRRENSGPPPPKNQQLEKRKK
jgi:hypothetical protein